MYGSVRAERGQAKYLGTSMNAAMRKHMKCVEDLTGVSLCAQASRLGVVTYIPVIL